MTRNFNSPFASRKLPPVSRCGRARRYLGTTAVLVSTCAGITSCHSDNDADFNHAGSGGAGGAGGQDAGLDAGDAPMGALRQAAVRSNKLLGAAVDVTALRDDLTYGEVLAREFNYVTPENDTGWFDLAGYVTLGYSAPPTAITLTINGPAAGVDICVAQVEMQPVTAQ